MNTLPDIDVVATHQVDITKTYAAAPLPAKHGIVRHGVLNMVTGNFVARRGSGRVIAFEEVSGAIRWAGLYNDGLMVE